MNFITTHILCEGTGIHALEAAIHSVIDSGAASLFILACDADGWEPAFVDSLLQNVPVPLFGGIFPSIVRDSNYYNSGTLVVGLQQAAEIFITENLSSTPDRFEQQLEEFAPRLQSARTLLTLFDGFSRNVQRFVEELYSAVGSHPGTIGCGAGSLELIQKPCLFTNKGLLQDAALIAALPQPHSPGVEHGWEIVDGPYLATGSRGNKLDTLNYMPAFNVYREQVEQVSACKFRDYDFFTLAKTHPLGIAGVDGEILVRDPILAEGSSLVCVGEIPQYATVYLLQGKPENLIASSGRAALNARKSSDDRRSKNSQLATSLVFDCISRSLFLEKTFNTELETICANLGDSAVFGTLSIGEISNSPKGPIELLNKSTVIAVF